MKSLFIVLGCVLNINFNNYCSEFKSSTSFFEIMSSYSADCGECNLHKTMIKIISNLSEKCDKKDIFELKFTQLLQEDSNNFNLSTLVALEITSIIELSKELALVKNIGFSEILIEEVLDAIKPFSKDIDYLKIIFNRTIIELAQDCDMRYEYALILLKKLDLIKSSDQLFNFLILLSNKISKNQNKSSGLIIFKNLLLQINKYENNASIDKYSTCTIL